MLKISLESDGKRVQSHIQGKSSVNEIMQIADAFCTMMVIALQHGGISEDDAQCVIASAALSATGFVNDQ